MKTFFLSVSFIVFFSWTGIAQQHKLQELLDKKQYARVLSYAASLQPSDTTDYAIMYLMGQACEGMLKYKQAYHYYKRCLAKDSIRAELLLNTARMAAYVGKSREAESLLQRIRRQDTTDFYANYQLARFYFGQGDYDKALTYYTFLLEDDPDNFVLIRSVGDCYSRLDNKEKALSAYLSAFDRNKESVSLVATLTNLLLSFGKAEEAVAICDTALKYHPDSRLLLQNKGLSLFSMQEYARADTIYSFLSAQGDTSYTTLKYGGCAKYYAEKYMDAIEPLEKAYRKDTTSVEVCLLLGSVLGRTYDRKRAFQLFDNAEALMLPPPALEDMLTRLRAETFDRDNQPNKAVELYYQLWTKSDRFDMLGRVWQHYRSPKIAEESDDYRRRCLFITVLFTSEYLKKDKQNKELRSYLHSQLTQFREEMFFRDVKELPMLSPDGKKGMCSLEQLETLIRKFPEKAK